MLRPATSATGVRSSIAQFLRPRPALAAAGVFVGGIVVHDWLPAAPVVYLAIAAVATLGAWLMVARARTALPLLVVALLAVGTALAQLRASYFGRGEIGLLASDEGRLAWLEVVVDTPPRVVVDPAVHYRNATPHDYAVGHVVLAKTWNGWQACSGNVSLLFGEAVPGLRVGQMVRIFGDLHRPPPAMNPGQFDWEAYCRHERILASVSVRSAGNVTVVRQAWPNPVEFLRAKTRELLAAGFDQSHAKDLAVLRTLVLGDNDPLVKETREDFQRAGGAHLLAVSGLHVGVLAFVVYLVCRLLRVGPRSSAVAVAVGIVLYGVVVQPNPPVVRAIALSLAFTATLFLQRKVDAVQLLSVVAIGLLAWDPLAVYEAGFQLSFGCVLGLTLLSPRLKEWFVELHDRDVAVAESFQRPRVARRWFVVGRDWGERYLAGGLVAWAVSLPMVAGHFSQVNPWALVAGVLLAPVVFVALVGGVIKVLLSLVLPFGAGWWAGMAGGLVQLMAWVADGLAKLPGSQLPVRLPAAGLVMVFYGVVLLAFVPFVSRRWAVLARVGGVVAVLGFALLPFWPRRSDRAVRVTLLSVGAGQCCVVEVPGERPVVIDAGSSTLNDPFRTVIGPYFQYEAMGSPQRVLVSHGDHDHIGAVGAMEAAYSVRQVMVSPHLGTGREARELEGQGVKPTVVSAGDRIELSKEVAVDVLWPPVEGTFSSNEGGLVLKLSYAGRSVLLPADIQAVAQTRLLERHPAELKADVLVAAHHGSSEVTTAAFLRAVGPKFILSSDDATPTRKQRTFDEMVGKVGIPLYHTHVGGALTVTIDPSGDIAVTTFRGTVR